ncbi:PEP-CTERM system histidine kinase PrsK [Nitrosomonas sp. GH22]|uniref:XrtA/PEP-CTERM system histidine kinase PrsK n=1 Tax=Nitrosomonas sp. GH22 TaxID=153947 RepID=UPI00136FD4C3|nr:XrtA/PEP-CTERM system histidine kinase PrsK [Nitrosomonas sp. GH22]MXS79338.1 PEP-CTERM system histidine kinase PrsK [Nitrosomonas sp. GH22]
MTTLSYAAAALAFFFLFMLLITSWRGRLYGLLLAIACIISSIWAAAIAGLSYWDYSDPLLPQILEILRNAALTTFLITLLGPFQSGKTNKTFPRIRPVVTAIALFYLVCLVQTITFSHTTTTSADSDQLGSSFEFLTWVTMAIIGMILVEQYYRNTPHEQRWGIKFICLGIGGLFVYDFYLYSDALLFRKISPDIWAARGWVNTLIVPLIALSAARNPKWTVGIAVSRRILFYSTALFGAAIYLLLMAAAGYYLRFSGGTWGAVFQLTFLFGAIVLLITVLFSGTTRSWLKVFISKHFFSYNYDYREEWLRFTRTLSEEETELKIRVIKSLAQLVESPAGAVWFKSEQNHAYQLIARWNIPYIDTSVEINSHFCRFMQESSWVIDLYQHDSGPQQYAAMILPDWLPTIPKARWVVPLILHGELLGFVVLTEPRSTVKFDWEVRDLLKVAGSQAASYLAQYEATQALSTARQFESFNRMSTFIVHDIKNLIAQLSLLLTNAVKHKDNPEFQQDMLDTVALSINKMKRLLEKLSDGGMHEEKNSLLSLDELLQQIIESKSFCEPRPVLNIIDPNLNIQADPSRLERVLGHLVQNAIEATPKDGYVEVRLGRQSGWAVIKIKDSGHGMNEQFIRDKLFTPFESTKTAGMGIGVFESREYVEQIGGKLHVSSEVSKGTVFSVMLPIAKSMQSPATPL